jgi:very-short-patch-repair endonuclease
MLGKRKSERDRSKYLSYDELKKCVRDLGIETKADYIKYLSINYLYNGRNIPYNPSTFYSKDIWEGWSIFLRDKIYKKNYNNTYYSYNECKNFVKKYNFKSKSDFLNRIKFIIDNQDIKIPYDPSKIYKNEWEGWVVFLDTDNDIEQIKELVDFDIARDYSRSLNLKMQKQWNDIRFSSLPKGMTKKPDINYKNKGWIDWYDFLGIDRRSRMSYGELLIAKILDDKNIKYKYNKPLKDCISSSKLRFDFYLPDYNICIEYDGKQHFESVEYFGGDIEFEKVKIRDNIKNEWCKVNDIKLLRFNYKQSKEEISNEIDSFI